MRVPIRSDYESEEEYQEAIGMYDEYCDRQYEEMKIRDYERSDA